MDDPIKRLAEGQWPALLQPLKPIVGQAALLFRYKYTIPYRKLVSGWVLGFYGDKNILYDFDTYSHRSYLSDFARHVRSPKINKFPYVLGDKLVFSVLLAGLGGPVAKIYAEHFNGRLVQFSDDPKITSLEDLLRTKKRLVVKPRGGSGGTGVHFISWEDGEFCVNGRTMSDLPKLGEHYIVSEVVLQHEYAASVYPRTTNSIRLLTMWDYSQNIPFIASGIHRFGTGRSFPVDNWGRGALSAYIDVETGILGRAAAKPASNSFKWYEHHPETSQCIAGLQVPGWDAIKSGVLSLASKLASVPYIGWDLVVTDQGFTIIEGNTRPDVNLLQIHQPLLLEDRVVNFYRTHGVVN